MTKEKQKLIEMVDKIEKKSTKNIHNAFIFYAMRILILEDINKDKEKLKQPKKD